MQFVKSVKAKFSCKGFVFVFLFCFALYVRDCIIEWYPEIGSERVVVPVHGNKTQKWSRGLPPLIF